jgi:hypothetical protein
MRCAETKDPRVARRHTHPTVGELSLNKATRFSRRSPQTDSITGHKKKQASRLQVGVGDFLGEI